MSAPEFVALREEEFRDLYDAIYGLPSSQQEVIFLRFMHNMRVSEIATLLEKNEGAVRMMLTRTLNNLRGFYRKHQREKR
jgi:RNA polymerase sigma-70 factor, ECF subfamily